MGYIFIFYVHFDLIILLHVKMLFKWSKIRNPKGRKESTPNGVRSWALEEDMPEFQSWLCHLLCDLKEVISTLKISVSNNTENRYLSGWLLRSWTHIRSIQQKTGAYGKAQEMTVFVNHVSDKDWISRIYNELLQLNNKTSSF